MPVRFLSDAERDRLSRFPPEITSEDLNTYFTLSQRDRHEVELHHRNVARLGAALQLCALRYLGFCPVDLSTAPPEAVELLAHQLDLPAEILARFGHRLQGLTIIFGKKCTLTYYSR